MDFWALLYTAIFSIICFESSFSNVLDRIRCVFCNIGEAFLTSGRKFSCRCCQHWTGLLSLLSQLACCLLEYDQCFSAILDFLAGPDIDESSLPCVSPSLLDPCPASDCKAAFWGLGLTILLWLVNNGGVMTSIHMYPTTLQANVGSLAGFGRAFLLLFNVWDGHLGQGLPLACPC